MQLAQTFIEYLNRITSMDALVLANRTENTEPIENPFRGVIVHRSEEMDIAVKTLGLWGVPDAVIAKIYLQTGIEHYRFSSDHEPGDPYWMMKAIFPNPVAIFEDEDSLDTLVIPKSTVKIHLAGEFPPLTGYRRDHVRRWWGWQRTDLSSLFPDSAFIDTKYAKIHHQK
ncbi:hypothetical protein C4573_05630 [Candidatus Woesearchaeota archaeon]|nr:MAG: hypothetical protein C4573_05630 [Candidatus Woesearchaeota archaeon]